MSLSVPPLTTGATQLEELISKYMEIESRPVASLKSARDALSVRSAMFRDLNASLLALKNASEALAPDDATSPYEARVAVSGDADVLTAQADSSAATGTYSVFVERLASSDAVVSGRFTDSGQEISQAAGEGAKTFTILVGGSPWDVVVTVAEGEDNATVLGNIAEAINSSGASAAVSAAVVSETAGESRLLITAKSTGSAGSIAVSEAGGTDNILAASGTTSSVQSSGASGGYLVPRDTLDAKFSLNGLAFVRSSNEVSDAIAGVTITLEKAQASGEAAVKLEVEVDVATVKSKIKSFISSYNSALAYLRSKTLVDPDAGTRGDLAGDAVYLDLKAKMSRIVQGRVEGVSYPDPSRLSDVGVTLDNAGNLVLSDEAELEEALSSNAAGVETLLASAGGVAAKMRDLLEPFVEELTGIIARQQESIARQMDNVDARVESLEERLAIREKALRSEFTSLLRAMQLMSAQSALLSSFMAQANSMFIY